MPACIQCQYFDKEKVKCLANCDKNGRSYTRNCVQAIFMQELSLCKGKILEIGGGHWKFPRKSIRKKPECQYFGVDPKWADNEALGGRKGSAAHIPFENNFFDIVLAFETMEHWG